MVAKSGQRLCNKLWIFWTRLNFAVVKALLSSPFIIINHFVSLWNWICCDYALFRSLFMSQNHRWPSHLKFVKTIEKPSLSMVNLRKNIQWWWSSGSKTIEKPSKAMVPQKKIITIPSSWKNYHRWSLTRGITRGISDVFMSQSSFNLSRDAKSGQHGQHACAIFSPSCANFWPVYAQNLLRLSIQHR